MFFEKTDLSVTLLDTMYLSQEGVHTRVSKRNFHALSFRFRSDAVVKTARDRIDMVDGTLSFFPASTAYERTANVDELIAVHFLAPYFSEDAIEHFIPRDSEAIGKKFKKIHELWQNKPSGYRYACTALFYEILAACHTTRESKKSSSRIAPSLAYIATHLTDPSLTVKQAAAASYMSEVYFRKLFKQETGSSPKQHIMRLRIQKAASLIAAGYYTLSEVATLSGYTDYKYFSVEFKRMMGVSPSRYLSK